LNTHLCQKTVIFVKTFSIMLVTYEVLNEGTLPILEQLERLHLLRRISDNDVEVETKALENTTDNKETLQKMLKNAQNQNEEAVQPAKKAAIPLRKKSLAGSLSPETAQKLRKHLEIVRNEWEHRI